MDETDPKEDFYRAIADSRAQERAEALGRLSARDDEEYRIIARAAEGIAEVVHGGAGADSVSGIMKSFEDLPPSTEWYGFLEIAGQVLLEKAFSSRDSALLGAGISIMEKVRGAGLPLSGLSADLVRKAAREESVSVRAKSLLEERR